MWLNSVSLGRFEVAGWGGCGRCGDGWASLMKVQAVDVCGNDGGGGDCEADGREAIGGHVTQEMRPLCAIHGALCISCARQGAVAAARNK